jgi:hypothetical protein
MPWQFLFDALAEFGARVLRFADNYAHELPSRLWDLALLQGPNLQSDWVWIGRWVLQSPAMHRIHHPTAVKNHDKNFGATFVFWDILFGTLCIEPRQRRDAIVTGVDDDPGTKRPWRYIVDVYVEFLRKAVAAAAGLVRPIGRFGR